MGSAWSYIRNASLEEFFPRFLHVSGERLIKERVDEGSREQARALKGPACGPVLLDVVKGLAAEQGWNLTINFFASACNHVTERYMSWPADSCVLIACVLVDAFAARSWNVSLCPWCQPSHRETGVFFAPYGLEDKVVQRARSDGVQAIFLVPVNRRAPFF